MTQVELLSSLLFYAGIPIDEWGVGKAKTIEDLSKEISAGETTIKIQRSVRLVAVTIAQPAPQQGKVLVLKEKKQVFPDGRERTRKLETSLGEKILPGESSLQAVIRALAEELRLTPEKAASIEVQGVSFKVEESLSYPGLSTVYEMHLFLVTLVAGCLDPSGFVIIEPDKEVHYVWE